MGASVRVVAWVGLFAVAAGCPNATTGAPPPCSGDACGAASASTSSGGGTSSSGGATSSGSSGAANTSSSSSSTGGPGGCTNPTVLTAGTFNGTTVGRGDALMGCAGASAAMGEGAPEQAWRLVLTDRKLVRLGVNGPFDATVYILEGDACGVASPVLPDTCTDRTFSGTENVVTYLDAGTYWVVVDGYRDPTTGNVSSGAYELTVSLADPCDGLTPEGTCTTDGARWCLNPPAGLRTVYTATAYCSADEECRTLAGRSRCYPRMDQGTSCTGSHNVCVSGTDMRLCNNGTWDTYACPNGCHQTIVGAICKETQALRDYRGTLRYEYRRPLPDLTDWAPSVSVAPAQGVLIYSIRYDATSQQTTFYDAVTARMDGSYTIRVPDPPTADDMLIVYAAVPSVTGGHFHIAVAEPDVADGTISIIEVPGTTGAWSWSIRPAVTPSGSDVTIREADGSMALRVLDNMRLVFEATAELYYRGTPARSFVVWFRNNTSWSCGECLLAYPATGVLGQTFDFQLFINGNPQDAQYWSDSTSFHEAGHWVMGNFGTSPREGGSHCLGVAYPPGLAWSEGWATWLSAHWRGNPRAVDKQNGSMFWLDIAARNSRRGDWPMPTPSGGILQNIYENEVSAMLWSMDEDPALGANPIFHALASQRGRQPMRGYTRHTWNTDDACLPVDVVDTGEPAVMFADLLDAMVCRGTPANVAARVDAATRPAQYYPYPSSSPVCP